MKPSARDTRESVFSIAAAVSELLTSARIPGSLCGEARYGCWHVSLSAAPAVHREALVDQPIGLEETEDGVWAIYFNTMLIATLDEREYLIRG